MRTHAARFHVLLPPSMCLEDSSRHGLTFALHPFHSCMFATVSFDDYYDAEAAVRGRDGVMLEGARLRVEMSRGGGGGYGYDPDRRGGYDEPRAPPRTLRVRTLDGVDCSSRDWARSLC